MLKQRDSLEKLLTQECKSISNNKKNCQETYSKLKEKFNIPIGISSDIITLRRDLCEFSEFILYALLFIIAENKVKNYFSAEEIKAYSKAKYKIEKFKLPYKMENMCQISEDQWIGSITVKELMKLRDAQLINYNENSQRTMQHIIDGEREYYKISLNKAAVSAIRESYERDLYIPNTITLNMTEDSDFSFSNNTLTIREIKQFDIIDGYHRYIAMSQIYDVNKDFDYNMEIRIVCFSEQKAQQFIYQEDQKTQMKKIDSDSLNQNNAGNIVCQRLNADPLCNLQGLINRNDGVISAGEFCLLINYFYFKNINKSDVKTRIIQVTKELKEKLNAITESNNE